jgi:DDE family transposase
VHRSERRPAQLTVRPQAHHEAIQAARQRQETTEFKALDALRAGVESSLSQGTRRVDLRRSRDIGLARTHLQQLLTVTAMNLVRVIAWLWGEALGERRRPPGHLAQRLTPSVVTSDGALLTTTDPTELVVTKVGPWRRPESCRPVARVFAALAAVRTPSPAPARRLHHRA